MKARKADFVSVVLKLFFKYYKTKLKVVVGSCCLFVLPRTLCTPYIRRRTFDKVVRHI